ncbi:MAG: peptidoglycan synthetase, partial [Nonlabens sp.]
FDREDLIVMTDPAAFKEWLFKQSLDNSALLLMSSGNYGGLDFKELADLV